MKVICFRIIKLFDLPTFEVQVREIKLCKRFAHKKNKQVFQELRNT